LAERVLGKDEVISSTLIMGSRQFAELNADKKQTTSTPINTGDKNG
jgi:hypothetical protein